MACSPSTPSAADKVFNTTELLEQILNEVGERNLRTLLLSQRVDKNFKAVIDGSSKLQQALLLKLDSIGRQNLPRFMNHNPFLGHRKIEDLRYFIGHNKLTICWSFHPSKKPQRSTKVKSWQKMYIKRGPLSVRQPFKVELKILSEQGRELSRQVFEMTGEVPLLLQEYERLAVARFSSMVELIRAPQEDRARILWDDSD